MLWEPVAKVESIRPGGILEGSVERYPLADLFMGILRGNLSGRLYFSLHSELRNWICFKDGVPVQVVLPDIDIPLRRTLVRLFPAQKALALEVGRMVASTGQNEEEILVHGASFSRGDLEELRQENKRDRVVELFDLPTIEFRFVEGELPDDDHSLIVLEPLPIVFAGLAGARVSSAVRRFIEERGQSLFVLAETFPPSVDPFGWGPRVQAVVTASDEDLSIDSLIQSGVSRATAVAAIVSLHLSGMITETTRQPGAPPGFERAWEVQEKPEIPVVMGTPVPMGQSDRPKEEGEAEGLVVLPRKGASTSRPAPSGEMYIPPSAPTPVPPLPPVRETIDPPRMEFRSVEERLGPLRNQTYFQLLRVTPGTPPTQVERAYRFLVRRVEEEGDDPGWRATKDLLAEAYRVLRDPPAAKIYRDLVEQSEVSRAARTERRAIEAEPKVERAVFVMALGRTGEARYLLAWAKQLDPTRADISPLTAMAEHLGQPHDVRAAGVNELSNIFAREVAKNPHDWRLKLCRGVLLAESGDHRAAHALLQVAPDPHHPLVEYARSLFEEEGWS